MTGKAGGDCRKLRQSPPASVPNFPAAVYTEAGRRSVTEMFRGNGNCILGIFAVAMGAGILIAAIFPVGALLFLVAFLLIACGCACCRK